MVLARPHMGDEVLAYFGYPQAYEHDAERAGLALVEAMPKAKPSPPVPCGCASASPPGLSSWATLLVPERPRNCRSWARLQIFPLDGDRRIKSSRRAFYWLRKLSGEPGHGQGKEMSSP